MTVKAITKLDNKAAHCHTPVLKGRCPFLWCCLDLTASSGLSTSKYVSLIPLHFVQTMFFSGKWANRLHKVTNFFQQWPYWTALMITGYCLMKSRPHHWQQWLQAFSTRQPEPVNPSPDKFSNLGLVFLQLLRFESAITITQSTDFQRFISSSDNLR